MSDNTLFCRFENGKIQVILLFVCPKTIDITEFLKKCCIATRTIQKIALRKLIMIDNAEKLDDLRAPPSNRLEALKGDRLGQYSIRINNQYRICFVFSELGIEQVEIVDYHK